MKKFQRPFRAVDSIRIKRYFFYSSFIFFLICFSFRGHVVYPSRFSRRAKFKSSCKRKYVRLTLCFLQPPTHSANSNFTIALFSFVHLLFHWTFQWRILDLRYRGSSLLTGKERLKPLPLHLPKHQIKIIDQWGCKWRNQRENSINS